MSRWVGLWKSLKTLFNILWDPANEGSDGGNNLYQSWWAKCGSEWNRMVINEGNTEMALEFCLNK